MHYYMFRGCTQHFAVFLQGWMEYHPRFGLSSQITLQHFSHCRYFVFIYGSKAQSGIRAILKI